MIIKYWKFRRHERKFSRYSLDRFFRKICGYFTCSWVKWACLEYSKHISSEMLNSMCPLNHHNYPFHMLSSDIRLPMFWTPHPSLFFKPVNCYSLTSFLSPQSITPVWADFFLLPLCSLLFCHVDLLNEHSGQKPSKQKKKKKRKAQSLLTQPIFVSELLLYWVFYSRPKDP